MFWSFIDMNSQSVYRLLDDLGLLPDRLRDVYEAHKLDDFVELEEIEKAAQDEPEQPKEEEKG